MREHEIIDSDGVFTLNTVTMELTNTGTKKSVVQFSHNCERITFSFPRIVEGHDLSLCDKVQIHYNNIEVKTKRQSRDIFEAADLRIDPEDEEKILFSWLIAGNATKYQGSLNFIVVCKCLDGTDAGYRLPTKTYKKLTVAESMDNGEAVAEAYSDLLESWRAEVLTEIEAAENACIEESENQILAIGNAGQAQKDELTAEGQRILTEAEEIRAEANEAAENAQNAKAAAEESTAAASGHADRAAEAAARAASSEEEVRLTVNLAADANAGAHEAANNALIYSADARNAAHQAQEHADAAAASADAAELAAVEARELVDTLRNFGETLNIYICPDYQVNDGMPLIGAPDSKTIYLTPSGEGSPDLYNEWVYINGKWERFGSGTANVDISGKLDKIWNDRGTSAVYAEDQNGNTDLISVYESAVSLSIPYRDYDGRIYANHPTDDYHVATKKYVDDHAGGGGGVTEVTNGSISEKGLYLLVMGFTQHIFYIEDPGRDYDYEFGHQFTFQHFPPNYSFWIQSYILRFRSGSTSIALKTLSLSITQGESFEEYQENYTREVHIYKLS